MSNFSTISWQEQVTFS